MARDARRARIVLLAAEGRPAPEIAELVGCAVNTAAAWRARYVDRGLAGWMTGALGAAGDGRGW